MIDWHEYIKLLVGLLVIVNPMLAIPEFITFTGGTSAEVRRTIARRTAMAVAIVIAVSAVGGKAILSAFEIRISAFQVGGGILILLMAIAMLHAKKSGARHTDDEAREAMDKEDIAIVPLAIPLLAGPGTISTVIIYSHLGTSIMHLFILMVLGLIVAFTVWLVLRAAEPIAKLLGNTGINIASRIMGLILAAIAVEFITQGLGQLLPGLAH